MVWFGAVWVVRETGNYQRLLGPPPTFLLKGEVQSLSIASCPGVGCTDGVFLLAILHSLSIVFAGSSRVYFGAFRPGLVVSATCLISASFLGLRGIIKQLSFGASGLRFHASKSKKINGVSFYVVSLIRFSAEQCVRSSPLSGRLMVLPSVGTRRLRLLACHAVGQNRWSAQLILSSDLLGHPPLPLQLRWFDV